MRKLSLLPALLPPILFIVACGATAAPAAPAARPAADPEILSSSPAEAVALPRAEFSETEIDLGVVGLNTWNEHRYTLRNTGEADLHVVEPIGVKVIAGC
ncbi:MAG: hypothetical protein QF719_06600 [Chloroflexota bacterium]|nr:hypothetical protein [Chloroflexota bacterium]MDP6508197.1 hypothetical protein [Chloroflexota bacterium]MDP6757867.1 hypothetical protein [Chloroflexota bacterium]